MNLKLSGRKLVNADILWPEFVLATFSDEISYDFVEKFICNIQNGMKVFQIYEQHRQNLSIGNVIAMLKKMEQVFLDYDKEMS